jgi:hypothetical protein
LSSTHMSVTHIGDAGLGKSQLLKYAQIVYFLVVGKFSLVVGMSQLLEYAQILKKFAQ